VLQGREEKDGVVKETHHHHHHYHYYIQMCRLLLHAGADVNARNRSGQTPCHYCFAYGFPDCGEFLISQGADEFAMNHSGLTPYEGLSKEEQDKS